MKRFLLEHIRIKFDQVQDGLVDCILMDLEDAVQSVLCRSVMSLELRHRILESDSWIESDVDGGGAMSVDLDSPLELMVAVRNCQVVMWSCRVDLFMMRSDSDTVQLEFDKHTTQIVAVDGLLRWDHSNSMEQTIKFYFLIPGRFRIDVVFSDISALPVRSLFVCIS